MKLLRSAFAFLFLLAVLLTAREVLAAFAQVRAMLALPRRMKKAARAALVWVREVVTR